MQVAYNLGAFSTDADRLIGILRQNGALLARRGVCLPEPAVFRQPMRDTLSALQGRAASAATATALCDAVTGEAADGLQRLIFSHAHFLAQPERILTPRGPYPFAGDRLGPLVNLFPQAQTEFYFALINPALLIGALVAQLRGRSYAEVMAGLRPEAIRWAPVVEAMVRGARGRPLTVWCNEDLPLVLPEVLRAIAGLSEEDPLAGEDGLLAALLTDDGLARLHDYIASRPPHSVAQRRKVVSAFLEQHARADALEQELPLPGWTEDLVGRITESYAADTTRVAALPGVRFIAP